jgi:hypothetical protein
MLVDVIAEVIGGVLPGPESHRAHLLMVLVTGLAACVFGGWLVVIGLDPYVAGDRVWATFVAAIVGGLGGAVVAGFSLLRSGPHPRLAALVFCINALALALCVTAGAA